MAAINIPPLSLRLACKLNQPLLPQPLNGEITMKRVLRNVFCGVGFCLLLLVFAEAQEVGVITAHIDGVQVHVRGRRDFQQLRYDLLKL